MFVNAKMLNYMDNICILAEGEAAKPRPLPSIADHCRARTPRPVGTSRAQCVYCRLPESTPI